MAIFSSGKCDSNRQGAILSEFTAQVKTVTSQLVGHMHVALKHSLGRSLDSYILGKNILVGRVGVADGGSKSI